MNFASDNAYGVLPEVWTAIEAADRGTALAYGNDALTKSLKSRFSDLFEREVAVFPVFTGTAANVVTRIEGLCRDLGEPILASPNMAALLPGKLASLGSHGLNGIPGRVEIYRPLL